MSDAALRYELAGELGELFPDRQEIIGLAQAHASSLEIADLPHGTPRTIWIYILVELSNRRDGDSIKNLLEVGKDHSKLVDWTRFERLTTPPAPALPAEPPTTTLWSHVNLDVRWEDEKQGVSELRVASEQTIIEALVTLQWAGTQPPDPKLDVRLAPLFGARRSLPVEWRPTESKIDYVANWTGTFPVVPGRFRTRRIVLCATTDHVTRRRTRYLASTLGYSCTLLLWLALAGFLFFWLSPLGAPVSLTGFGVWGVTFGFAWILPRVKALSGRWLWVSRVWETTVPLVLCMGALGVVLPIVLLVDVINYSSSAVTIDGTAVQPGDRKTFLRTVVERRNAPPHTCVCQIDPPGCACVDEDVRWVDHIEIACKSRVDGQCMEWRRIRLAELSDRKLEGLSGDVQVPLDWPAGFRKLEVSNEALRTLTTVKSGERTITFSSIVIAPDAPKTLSLAILAGTNVEAQWGNTGTLRCDLSSTTTDARIDIVNVRGHVERFGIKTGRVGSTWNGTAGPYGCFGRGSLAEIDAGTLTRGVHIQLPSDRGITNVSLNGSESIACPQPRLLRIVALRGQMPEYRKLEIGSAGLVRLDGRLGATCGEIGDIAQFDAERLRCQLRDDSFDCEQIPRPPRRVPCTLTPNGVVNPVASPNCQRLGDSETARRAISTGRQRGFICTSVDHCR